MSFSSFFQVAMVGADVCGFSYGEHPFPFLSFPFLSFSFSFSFCQPIRLTLNIDTNEELCARWARLGAFYTFYRDHNNLGYIPQEFYQWPIVAESGRKAIDLRYRLLDYIYTAVNRQSRTGDPVLQPLFYLYPLDANTFGIELQFFFGDSIMVSPVTDAGLSSVDVYFPDDIFYEWPTGAPVRGRGASITLENIGITDIPVHIRGGSIIPLRASSANTTKELRTKPFQLLIAPGLDGTASGSLYLDDGESIDPAVTLEVEFYFKNGRLQFDGQFGGYADTLVESVVLLGQETAHAARSEYDSHHRTATIKTNLVLDKPGSITF